MIFIDFLVVLYRLHKISVYLFENHKQELKQNHINYYDKKFRKQVDIVSLKKKISKFTYLPVKMIDEIQHIYIQFILSVSGFFLTLVLILLHIQSL